MFYICKHFDIVELVDESTYKQFGNDAWMFFNPVALRQLDMIREYFGASMTVNNWHNGGQFQFRGFRPITCSIGGTYSQHRLGNAFDCDIKGMTAEAVRQEILTHKDHLMFKDITCIEDKVNWFHFDCRNIHYRIRIVRP